MCARANDLANNLKARGLDEVLHVLDPVLGQRVRTGESDNSEHTILYDLHVGLGLLSASVQRDASVTVVAEYETLEHGDQNFLLKTVALELFEQIDVWPNGG